jgi:hypothetical protein
MLLEICILFLTLLFPLYRAMDLDWLLFNTFYNRNWTWDMNVSSHYMSHLLKMEARALYQSMCWIQWEHRKSCGTRVALNNQKIQHFLMEMGIRIITWGRISLPCAGWPRSECTPFIFDTIAVMDECLTWAHTWWLKSSEHHYGDLHCRSTVEFCAMFWQMYCADNPGSCEWSCP